MSATASESVTATDPNNRNSSKCFYCKKVGRIILDCRARKRKEEKAAAEYARCAATAWRATPSGDAAASSVECSARRGCRVWTQPYYAIPLPPFAPHTRAAQSTSNGGGGGGGGGEPARGVSGSGSARWRITRARALGSIAEYGDDARKGEMSEMEDGAEGKSTRGGYWGTRTRRTRSRDAFGHSHTGQGNTRQLRAHVGTHIHTDTRTHKLRQSDRLVNSATPRFVHQSGCLSLGIRRSQTKLVECPVVLRMPLRSSVLYIGHS